MDPQEPIKAFRDTQAEVEKMMKYRYRDKEQQRSNRAAGMHESAIGTKRRCLPYPSHQKIAWVGPPYDRIRAYVCLNCNAAASEPEIIDRGYKFETVPDFAIHAIFDLDLERQSEMPRSYTGFGEPFASPQTGEPFASPQTGGGAGGQF